MTVVCVRLAMNNHYVVTQKATMLSRMITQEPMEKRVHRIVLCDPLVQLDDFSSSYLWNINSVVFFSLQSMCVSGR